MNFLNVAAGNMKCSTWDKSFNSRINSPLPNIPSRGEKVSHIHVHAKLLQLCPTLCNPMDCSLPGFSVHGILHARILAIYKYSPFPSPGDLPNPGIDLVSPVLAGIFFTISATWEVSHVHFYSITVFQFHNRNVWLPLLLWNRLTGLFL